MTTRHPSPIVSTRLPECERLNGALRPLLLDLASTRPGRESNNPAGTSYFTRKWLSDRQLFQRPEPAIAGLVAAVEEEASRHAWPGLPVAARLTVCAMWAIVSRPGMEGVPHRHNGDVSGAYYVDAGAGGDSGGAFTVHGADGREEERIRPFAGQLLLFPSSMLHGVEPYRAARPRIVVSFNLRPTPVPREGLQASNR